MRDMILLNRVLAGLLLCVLLLPAAYCRAGEREEAAIRYFTAEPAGRYYMYSFLREKLKGEEALPEEEDRVRRVLEKLITAAISVHEFSASGESWQLDSEPWVLVTPDEKFNAYALPGGIFVVNIVYNTDNDNIDEDVLYSTFADIIKTIQLQEDTDEE